MMKTVTKDKYSNLTLSLELRVTRAMQWFTVLTPQTMENEKCEKLICNLYDKKNYVMYIKGLKQALDHRLKLKKAKVTNFV